MSLEDWHHNAWLVKAEPKVAEIVQLFDVVDREISDASVEKMSVDGKFMHAYDAALTLCTICLRASGYRVEKGGSHHKRTIESIPLTLGQRYSSLADQIDLASRRRNQAMYHRTGVVQQVDADDLLKAAIELRIEVVAWLLANHPHLKPPKIQ